MDAYVSFKKSHGESGAVCFEAFHESGTEHSGAASSVSLAFCVLKRFVSLVWFVSDDEPFTMSSSWFQIFS